VDVIAKLFYVSCRFQIGSSDISTILIKLMVNYQPSRFAFSVIVKGKKALNWMNEGS
jgi:hypothetical protein